MTLSRVPYAFSNALKAWIKRERLDTQSAADLLGVSPRDVRRWRSGSLPDNQAITEVLTRIAEHK
jgi:hypothetical protein